MKTADIFESKFNSSGTGNFKPTVISAEEFVQIAEQRSPKYLARIRDYPIYRGVTAFGVRWGDIDTNGFTRTSANTQNYYTLWIDNNPEWADYPKRSKSLICTSDFSYASGYGEVYLIIPEDNAQIGICPQGDMWLSFNETLSKLQHGRLDDFMSSMHYVFQAFNIAAPSTYAQLVSATKKVSLKSINKLIEDFNNGHDDSDDDMKKLRFYIQSVITIRDGMRQIGAKTLYDVFEIVISPKENNFSNTTAAHYSISPALGGVNSKECWVQGKCLVLSHNVARGKLNNVLNDFIHKYKIEV